MENKNIISYTIEKHEWEDEKKQKRKSKIWIILLSFLVCLCVGAVFVAGYFVGKLPSQVTSSNEKLQYVKDIMKNKWYFSKDYSEIENTLDDLALNGITSFQEDKHTEYLSKEQLQFMNQTLQGTFYGIGVAYTVINDTHVINKVYQNSPAEKAGIHKNDLLLKVDGISTKGISSDEIGKLVRGPKGTKVTLTVLRDGKEQVLDIYRDNVSVALESDIVDGVGIVHLNSFTENGGSEMLKTFTDFESKNVKKVIIDLRDNGGGYLKTTLDIAGLLMPKNSVILQQEDVNGFITTNKTSANKQFKFEKIVVIVNGQSASASEVLAAALRENLNVKIVGEKSFGKGTVQVSEMFKDGSGIKYTVAQWLTPKGNHINRVGVIPDVIVAENPIFKYMETPKTFKLSLDSVSDITAVTQKILRYLGFTVAREDGYFDQSTFNAIKAFQTQKNILVNGELNENLFTLLRVAAQQKSNINPISGDTQLKKALEIINE